MADFAVVLLNICVVLVSLCCIAGINAFDQTPPEKWFQMNDVLRVSLGNFLFFAIFALMMMLSVSHWLHDEI
jgi:hypothetical protein